MLYSLHIIQSGSTCLLTFFFSLRMCGIDTELAKDIAKGKEPAGTAAITTGRLRMNTVYCWSCCLWAEMWGIMTWIRNRPINKAWIPNPQTKQEILFWGRRL